MQLAPTRRKLHANLPSGTFITRGPTERLPSRLTPVCLLMCCTIIQTYSSFVGGPMQMTSSGWARDARWLVSTGILAATAVVVPAHAQSRTLPAGTVLNVTTTAPLQSASAQTG